MTRRSVSPERWLYAGLVFSTTAAASVRLWSILRVDGFTHLKFILLVLFTILFCWICASFWLCVIGAWARWSRSQLPVRTRSEQQMRALRPRVAVVMPIFNEEVSPVFARLQAIGESVAASGARSLFDFFLLSDSTDLQNCRAEEAGFRALRAQSGSRVYYRHRTPNGGRKSGNIRDFCENWGAAYEYMVVLDADSLMTGDTLVSLVQLMDDNPRAALIQVPPFLIGRHSLFARLQQFASSVYGPLYWEGLAFLQGPDSNYWGHNAILRVAPFVRHCGLPRLPGRAPLGGEILSHDFVEAALLRRAGWELWMAPELGGSYEESPPTLLHYLKRDRRWCEGNLQHMRLIFARGFHGSSRVHLAVGVMSYLSAPLWLAMLVVAAVETFREQHFAPALFAGRFPMLALPISHAMESVILVLGAALLLLGPKFLGWWMLVREPRRLAAHGGLKNAFGSVLFESVISTLLAPVVMISQSMFVASVLAGRSTTWTAQQRGSRGLGWRAAARAFVPHTVVAGVATVLIWQYIPSCFWWLAPLVAGPALSIPLALISGSPAVGRFAARLGLLLVPSETAGLPVPSRFESLAG
ncbi:MAG TPA: glucans biosynthesis glucosyltransferase MdoH [Rhizomicrobium sp.]|jgi:membrane glycosyltransferase